MRVLLAASYVLLFALGARPAALPPQIVRDSVQVEAAFALNLLRFVEWPTGAFAGADDPFRIVIVGDDALAEELRRISRGKVVSSRRIEVLSAPWTDSLPAAHLLLIMEADGGKVRRTLEGVRTSTVTIGRAKEFLTSGGTIRFLIEGDLLRFEVNLESARRANVMIGAKVLLLAKKIIGVAPEPSR